MARHANISGAAVSRVLSGNDSYSVSPEMRARVLKAAAEFGYRPQSHGTSGRSGLVGLWMSLD